MPAHLAKVVGERLVVVKGQDVQAGLPRALFGGAQCRHHVAAAVDAQHVHLHAALLGRGLEQQACRRVCTRAAPEGKLLCCRCFAVDDLHVHLHAALLGRDSEQQACRRIVAACKRDTHTSIMIPLDMDMVGCHRGKLLWGRRLAKRMRRPLPGVHTEQRERARLVMHGIHGGAQRMGVHAGAAESRARGLRAWQACKHTCAHACMHTQARTHLHARAHDGGAHPRSARGHI